MKKAIAKCSHEDAPELSLPPYRSSYRFVNTMINNHSSSSYHSDDNDMYDMFSEMFDSSSDRMDNYRSSDYSNQMGRMSHFKNMFNNMRYKRAAGDNLDLGDRLVEKLAEQKHHMEAKTGNMTCVMKELNVLDASNNIDVQAMKRDIQKYTMPSEWFKNKYEHLLDTCYEMATNLPAENSIVTGETFGTVKLGEVKMFTKCCEKAKTKLCMHQDIKNKVESNFGPMEDILQETQLTEHE